VYCLKYGRGQDLERLAERGGFYWGELDGLYPQWRDESSEILSLRSRLSGIEDMYRRASQERLEAQSALVENGRLVEELKKEIKGYSFCEKHKSKGGSYANCLHCGLVEMTKALDDIDLLTCDEECREMGGNLFGVDYNPPGVVERITKLVEQLKANQKPSEPRPPKKLPGDA
jgi:hypothetical protein